VRLRGRLTLVVTGVVLVAVAVTALLSVQVASQRVGRLLEAPAASSSAAPAGRGPGAGRAAGGTGATAVGPAGAAARRALLVRDLWRANAEGAAIALLLAAVAGTLLAARLARPLRRLTAVAQRYASGERDVRAATEGHDEVAEVGAAFNRLADRLQTEEEQQQRLIADIAHELRTPLTILRGELEALEDGLMPGTPETYHRLGDEIALLTRLVGDLRLLTRAESGELELERAPVGLEELVRQVCDSFQNRAGDRRLELDVALEPAMVDGDASRLRQVLVNLLDNAARHAPEASRIEVRLRRDGGRAVLSVRDHGPGIPEVELQRVFRRFYRTDAARSRAAGGSGLGLSIVRSLVALHGGTVTASNHPQGGALLSVSLPLVPAPHAAASAGDAA